MDYTVSETTRNKLQQLIDQGVGGADDSSASPAKQVAFVRITGAVSGGYYPCVPSTAINSDTWLDHTAVCEVKAANAETLTNGNRYLAVRTGEVSGKPRYRCAVGGGEGRVITCSALADNPGGGVWSNGQNAITTEPVELQPRYGSPFAVGTFSFPAHKLFSGLEYVCRDSGTINTGNGKRRYHAFPIGLIACDSSDPNNPTLRML